MQEISNSSSVTHQPALQAGRKHQPWRLWLVVLGLHAVVLAGMDAALTVGRLAAQEPSAVEVAIITEAKNNLQPPPQKTSPAAPPNSAPSPPPIEAVLDAAPTAPEGVAIAAPATEPPPMAVTVPLPVIATAPQAADVVPLRPVTLPPSTELRYQLIKGSDTAKASLVWRVLPNRAYELTIEATYFGFSALRQTSIGSIEAAGLAPVRYGDKRRGKSEQATHFDYDKKAMTFSNNRPQAALRAGSQDRASMLLQLSGMFAAEPEHYPQGSVIPLPIANTDELELWLFEVQGQDILDLPTGQREAIKLTRRPRRAFDQTVELWLSPAEHYLPVRIRLTDSSGVTDQLLTGRD